MTDRKVAPLAEQSEVESQRVWADVTKPLLEFNYSAAGAAKTIIEDHQRDLAKQRAETGEKFDHALFYYDDESERWLLKNYEQRFEDISQVSS